MSRSILSTVHLSAPFLILSSLLAACGGGSSGTSSSGGGSAQSAATADQMMQLTCGSHTYRLSKDKVTGDILGSCDQVTKSLKALRSYRAAKVRFTCRESDGSVVKSVAIPEHQLDDYKLECQEYLAAKDAYIHALKERGTDKHALFEMHRAAYSKLNGGGNDLVRQSAEEDSALYRKKIADQAVLENVIKDLGGSIEIPP